MDKLTWEKAVNTVALANAMCQTDLKVILNNEGLMELYTGTNELLMIAHNFQEIDAYLAGMCIGERNGRPEGTSFLPREWSLFQLGLKHGLRLHERKM